ncbi:MAG: DegV family protein [Anaerolineae bacterium]|nr:DegV family protein [Anaerolineae bacterium]
MTSFVVVTDSTSNLSPGPAEELGIPVIPLNVHWGEASYLDGVTLEAETFYRWLQERQDLPKTSQPSAGAFIDFFQQIADRENVKAVLGLFISEELSGTMASALQAKAHLAEHRPDLRIEVVDSRSVSTGLGLQVLVAERVARQGGTIEAAMDKARWCSENTHVLFAVDTLEYLHRGGRIGGAARLLGSALNLKPVLTIAHGRVESLEKVRSRGKSLRRLVEIARERLGDRRPTELAIMHAAAPEDLAAFTEMVVEELKPERLLTRLLSPVVGTHAGPGALGFAFYAEDPIG